jgi:hypothetical protein
MAQVGDVFTIPLGDGRNAIGQIFEKKSAPRLAVIAVFEQLFPAETNPVAGDLESCISAKPVLLASSFETFVDEGRWKRLMNIPPFLERSNSPAFRVAGIPFGILLQSYDGTRKRAARFREINAAPNGYSVSAKCLENAVKAYFKAAGDWEPRFDKLLFKNVVPFGVS